MRLFCLLHHASSKAHARIAFILRRNSAHREDTEAYSTMRALGVYRLDSSVGRASAFGAGGRGFESHSRTISKVYEMVLAAPLLTLA